MTVARLGMMRQDYAAHRGVDKSMVSKWVKQGKLTPPAVLADGSIDRDAADRQLAEVLDPGLAKRFRAPASVNSAPSVPPAAVEVLGAFGDAKQRKAMADAKLAEMELQRKQGELVPAKACHEAAREIAGYVGQLLDGRRMQLAAELVGVRSTSDAAAILERSDRDFRRTLGEVASREMGRAVAA